MKLRLTRSGLQSMIMALQGTGITFTKVVIGNGDCPENYQAAEDLTNPVVELGIDEVHQEEDYASITVTYTNQRAESTWEWSEVGVFCLNPFSTELEPLPDLMYAYGHSTLDGISSVTIPQKGQTIFEIREVYRIYVGEVDNITAIINENSTFVTNYEFNAHKEADNPHGITAATIGLENVQNVPVDDMAPSFEVEEGEVENIESGETMQVLMGKIAKVITSYLEHTNADNPHGLTAAKIGAAEKSHVHTATDVTSGVLGTARGGTGNSTVDTNPTAGSTKMVTSGGIYNALSKKSDTSHKHAAGDITSGTLPVARGGTGQTSLASVAVGHASTSDKLKTARQLRVNLENNTTAQTFDGSVNKDLSVLGTLKVANGGTGFNTVDTAPTAGSSRMVTSSGIKTYVDRVAAPSTSGANSGYINFANGLKLVWLNVQIGASYTLAENASVAIYPALPCSISAVYCGMCSFQGHSGIVPGDPNFNSSSRIAVWLQNVVGSTITVESTHRIKAILIAK